MAETLGNEQQSAQLMAFLGFRAPVEIGAASDLKQDAAAEGGATDKAKLFGGRWKNSMDAERPGLPDLNNTVRSLLRLLTSCYDHRALPGASLELHGRVAARLGQSRCRCRQLTNIKCTSHTRSVCVASHVWSAGTKFSVNDCVHTQLPHVSAPPVYRYCMRMRSHL